MADPRADPHVSEHPGGEVRHLPARIEPVRPRVLEPAGPRTLAAEREPALPAPVAAAAGGFLVGLATLVLARALGLRGRGRRLAVRRSRRERTLAVSGSRSFLVDVHLLKR